MDKFRILVLNTISEKGLAVFPSDRYWQGKEMEDPHAVLVRSFDLHAFALGKSLLAVARAGAGVNNIPVDKLTHLGVPVFNTPGANANAVKELVLASMILASRHLMAAHDFVEGLPEDDTVLSHQVESGKKRFSGNELLGKTLAVAGLGAIGGRVAEAALALGMRVVGFDPKITVEAAWRLPSQITQAHSLEEAAREADFLSVHVPLTSDTRMMVGEKILRLLPQGAALLNFSRSEVVDETAVLEALKREWLSYYLCDFPSAALKTHPRVVAFPHLGASTAESEENCAVMAAQQLRAYLEDGAIRNSVNFPSVVMDRESPFRLAVAHNNVPSMLAQISSVLGGFGLNIHNMVNKSRGDAAYTLADADSPIEMGMVEALSAIEGVWRVRTL